MKWFFECWNEIEAFLVRLAAVEGSSGQLRPDSGFEIFVLSDGGASATWTLRAIRLKPYRD